MLLGDPFRVDVLSSIDHPWVDSLAALVRMTQGYLATSWLVTLSG